MLKDFMHYKGWKRRGVAALFGAFATAALPPVYILPLLIPSLSGLMLLIIAAPTKRQAFLDGWWWGLGYFTTGLYWMCNSLYVEPEKFAWLTPFALFGLPSVLAIYIGVVALAFYCLKNVSVNRPSIHALFLPIIFATIFVAVEYLRTILFWGFPWNLIGYVWAVSDATLQPAWAVGIYGLSWLTVFIASAPALFALKKPFAANMLAVLLLASMIGYGEFRLTYNPTRLSDVKIRLVQANIPQTDKWAPNLAHDILAKYIHLSNAPGVEDVKLVIWPEAALPYYMEGQLAHYLGSKLPPHTLLMAGGLRGSEEGGDKKAWNSLLVINHDGEILSHYDKHHLVPFGEFIPFRKILPLENISGGHGDFAAGEGPATLTFSDIPPVSPLICYETIFPDEATDHKDQVKWLLNITNDAWFGATSEPYQALAMARVRAVENGLPLVRAANTGISAVIDPYGRVLKSSALEKTEIVDIYLPLPKL